MHRLLWDGVLTLASTLEAAPPEVAAALWAADLFPALLRCYDVTLPCLAHLIDGGSGGGGSATTFRVRHGRLRAAIVRVTFALLDLILWFKSFRH